jgi:hypothetical protein
MLQTIAWLGDFLISELLMVSEHVVAFRTPTDANGLLLRVSLRQPASVSSSRVLSTVRFFRGGVESTASPRNLPQDTYLSD